MAHLSKAAVVFLMVTICVLGWIVTDKVREQTPPPAPRDLFALVNQQLTAVREADFDSAYRFAAAGVQQRFTRSEFEQMLRAQFPEIMRGSRIEFGEARIDGARALVRVYVLGANGSTRAFLYRLMREANVWKIDGAEELKSSATIRRLAGRHA